MPRRIAVSLALIAFALCLVAGVQAGNTFTTVVSKALVAMVVTLIVGSIVGAMAQRMLDEHLATEEKKSEIAKVSEGNAMPSDR